MGAVPGHRYVRIRLADSGALSSRLAMLGHELRHAVELADAPHVRDEPAMARLYQEIGFERSEGPVNRPFDSDAAIEAGYQILRELMGRRSS